MDLLGSRCMQAVDGGVHSQHKVSPVLILSSGKSCEQALAHCLLMQKKVGLGERSSLPMTPSTLTPRSVSAQWEDEPHNVSPAGPLSARNPVRRWKGHDPTRALQVRPMVPLALRA